MDVPPEFPTEVVTDDGYVHRLAPEPLGQGGQGVVFRTRDRDTAVKLLTDPAGQPLRITDPQRRARLCRQLTGVRLLPLPDPDELHLAMPAGLLEPPYIGYWMRLLDGMQPISKLIAPAAADLREAYAQTGGLRRRLVLLARAATILARLHGVPVVYADLSFNNVFVSADPSAHEVWLIDADNLHYLSTRGPRIYTPGFGAPEVVQGTSGVTTLTDVHAFAVLAFYVLAQQHPFLGDYVTEGPGWSRQGPGDAEDREALAFRGALPWIHDEADRSNRTDNGIPRELVLSPLLWDLFRATFGAGRTDPGARPGMRHWVEAFHRAADFTVVCPTPGCGWSYYRNIPGKQCPICEAPRPGIVAIEARLWDPDLDEDEFDPASGRQVLGPPEPAAGQGRPPGSEVSRPLWHKILTLGRDDVIHRHVVTTTLFRDGDPPAFDVACGRNALTLTPVDEGEYHLVRPDGRRRDRLARDQPCTLALGDLNRGTYIHCGPLDRAHRLLIFGYFPGARP